MLSDFDGRNHITMVEVGKFEICLVSIHDVNVDMDDFSSEQVRIRDWMKRSCSTVIKDFVEKNQVCDEQRVKRFRS